MKNKFITTDIRLACLSSSKNRKERKKERDELKNNGTVSKAKAKEFTYEELAALVELN